METRLAVAHFDWLTGTINLALYSTFDTYALAEAWINDTAPVGSYQIQKVTVKS